MIWDSIRYQLLQYQARLSLWWINLVCDTHDLMTWDAMIRESLDRLNLEYDQYTLVPGFNYQNLVPTHWPVLLVNQGRWSKIQIPHPLATTSSDIEPVSFDRVTEMITEPI